MSTQRFEAEELDSASVDYLRAVRENDGRGAPGVYLDAQAAGLTEARLPIWSLIGGILLLLFGLLVVWLVILQDPFKVAFLATALFFLGGWMVVAWVRCLIARQRSRYLGHFKYCDPLYFWHASGTGVWVTPLRGLLDARCRHNAGSTDSTVRVVLEEEAFDVPVKSDYLAEGLEVYLNEVAASDKGLPIDRGFRALARAELDDGDDEPVVEAIPEPHKAHMSLSWLRYPVVLVLFAAMFGVNYVLCKAWRDSSIFGRAKTPGDLRAYLADPRNTRYRDKAQSQLDALHERAAKQIEAQPGEAALTRGLASVVRALRTSPTPILTVGVVRSPRKEPTSMEAILGPAVMPVTASVMIKQLASSLSPGQMNAIVGSPLGEQIVVFGEATEGFAMIQIDGRLRRPGGAEEGGPVGGSSIVWTVTLQADEKAPKHTLAWKEDIRANNADDLEKAFRDSCNKFPGQLVGYLRNKVPANLKP
jgi:hypothetical protein